jgi:histidine triad (HIT) family protein
VTGETVEGCVFCKIVSRELPAAVVFEDAACVVFLDQRPLFPGHCLVVPRQHYETYLDLPDATAAQLTLTTQLAARAVRQGMAADGVYLAINNTVSQTVPHVHVHVVPRRWHDGLHGFFWPRQQYPDDAEMERVRAAIAAAAAQLGSQEEDG